MLTVHAKPQLCRILLFLIFCDYLLCLSPSLCLQVHACVGGTAVRDDIRTLQNGVHIVVGTPGRVFDMINRGALRLDRVGLFVLDEADEMLSRGFKDQIYDVFQYLPERVQVRRSTGLA